MEKKEFTMQDYLNKGIKEIITQYPEVADILNEYNIGCVPCNVGSCLLKDIVEIHNLSTAEEEELILSIAKVIFPDKDIEIPKIERKERVAQREIKYSPPLKKLVNEHVLIKRMVALIPVIIENLDLKREIDRSMILKIVDFIRSYADKYHHAKEEEILFKYFDEGLDILDVMHKDHESARAHVQAILEAVDREDTQKVCQRLHAYYELLNEHIKKEDEILYPWMDRNLSDTQIGHLYAKFNEVDAEFGDTPERYEEFVDKLEKQFSKKKEVKL